LKIGCFFSSITKITVPIFSSLNVIFVPAFHPGLISISKIFPSPLFEILNFFSPPVYKITTHNIKIDLEMLYTGGEKKFKISNNGDGKIFDIDIKPGWKAGTKITFKDENIGTVIFVIEEKKHPIFKRIDSDLRYKYKIN
jgi:hypothetical protein